MRVIFRLDIETFALAKGLAPGYVSRMVYNRGLPGFEVTLTNGRGGERKAVTLYEVDKLEGLIQATQGPEVKLAIIELHLLGWKPEKIAGLLKLCTGKVFEALEEWERSEGFIEIKSKI